MAKSAFGEVGDLAPSTLGFSSRYTALQIWQNPHLEGFKKAKHTGFFTFLKMKLNSLP